MGPEGKDATTNEIVVKKHTEPDDLVFHTDMAGSPFFLLSKGRGRRRRHSRPAPSSGAWRLGLTISDVLDVRPNQVTKETNTGEFIPKAPL